MRHIMLVLGMLLVIGLCACYVRPYGPPAPRHHHYYQHQPRHQNCYETCAAWGYRQPCHGCRPQRVCLRNETRCR